MTSLFQCVKQDKWGQMPETGTFPKGERNRKLVSCQNRWRVDMDTSDRQGSETFQGSDQASPRLSLRLQGKAPQGRLSEMVSGVSGHMRNSSSG